MRKFSFLLFAIIVLLSATALMPAALAQEEINVLEDVVLPRLEEYGANLPAKYGTIGVADFATLLAEEDVTILDVRELAEVEETGVIEGSIHIPLRELGENLAMLPDAEATIVVVCKGGFRATIGMTALHVLGYDNARVLTGGFDAWVGEDLPVVAAPAGFEPLAVPETFDPLLVEHVATYLADLPPGFGGVGALDLFEEMFDAPPDYLIDVRSEAEWLDPGYIEDAQHLWIDEFTARMDEWPEALDANTVVYCASGYRGGVVTTMLGLMGYENVRNLAGGINGWVAADLPLIS